MKTFTCTICGETVTRPKSVGTKDGKRICRSHPEGQARLEEIRMGEHMKITVASLQIRDRGLRSIPERTIAAAVAKTVLEEFTPEERELLGELTAMK